MAKAAKKGRDSSSSDAEDDNPTDVYQMEDIRDYRIEGGIEQFLVKWQNYSDEDATWEPESNILNPGDLLLGRMNAHRESYQARNANRGIKRRRAESVTPSSVASVASATRPSRAATKTATADVSAKTEKSSPVNKPAAPRRGSQKPSGAPPADKEKEKEKEKGKSLPAGPSPKRPATADKKDEKAAKGKEPSTSRRSSESKGGKLNLRQNNPDVAYKVVHISKDNQMTMKVAMSKASIAAPEDEGDLTWLPMGEARQDFKDELLDYLLDRVRFREPKQ